MFKLRDYQKEAVGAAVQYLQGKSTKPGILVAPTGCGKSILVGKIIKEMGVPSLVIQPSKEILEQNVEKALALGLKPTIYSASCGIKELSELTYATLKSIKKDVDNLKKYGIRLLLLDECHSGYSPEPDSEFMKFVTRFNDVKVLGLTATPCRLRSYGFADWNYSMLNILTKDDTVYFRNIVHVTQIKELVDKKFWSPLVYERWTFDKSDLQLNTTGSEYSQESIKASIEKSGLNNTIYKRILGLMKERKHILVCMDSVESCNIISEFMNRKFGHITDVVYAGTPKKKRSKIVEDFKEGKLKIVFNYASLSTGFDFPELDCIVFGRPTLSYSVWYQALGRVVRIHPNKKNALVVDCCDNYRRFGRIEDMSIEKFPGYGWCMFAGNKLLTGVCLAVDVTKQMMQDKINRIVARENSQELGNTIMWFGEYEGQRFQSIPAPYFDFLVNNMDFTNKPARFKKIIEWHNIIKLD